MSVEEDRSKLYKTIWEVANKLRGSIDGWDFKQYFLGILFYRYISEEFANFINKNEWKAGDKNFRYEDEKDEDWEKSEQTEELVKSKGYFIPPSHLFCNILKNHRRNDKNLNEVLRNVFDSIDNYAKQASDTSEKLSGLFDDIDLESNKLEKTVSSRNRKIMEVMESIDELNLGNPENRETDIFGDAYEYLMGMYASNAGKSGGEYYTPPEVSELMVKLILANTSNIQRIYDPACGSGSLLLKFIKIRDKEYDDLEIYGQEINFTTYNLCRMNILLHGIGYEKFNIYCGDTLSDPKIDPDVLKFEGIVSNPPYSSKWRSDDDTKLQSDVRFTSAGALAPKKAADLAFVLDCLYRLHPSGTAAIITFPGIMYRGGAEQKIRQYLIDNNFVDCIISLADNFFYGTSIQTCILVLKKNKTEAKTLFIDAESQYEKVKNKNKLSPENINWILEIYKERRDIPYVSRLVDNTEIAEEEYKLSVSAYVEKEDKREKIDIDELNAELERVEARTTELRKKIRELVKTLSN